MSTKKKASAETEEPKEKKEKKNLDFGAATALLLKMAEKASEKDPKAMDGLMLASDVTKGWKYSDFCDITVKARRPFLPFEFFFGTRGLLNGRVLKIDADEATGKSSMLYLIYGMMQRTCESFIQHHEAESAPMPPDRIAKLGCDPMRLFQGEPTGVDDCIEKMENFVKTIREVNQDNSIVQGIDSVSGLAQQGLDLETGAVGEDGNQGLGYHARAFSKFFRERLKYFSHQNVIILATGQNKQQIVTTTFGQKSQGKTCIADGTFKFHASWMIDMKSKNGLDNCAEIECVMTKNKLAAKGRKITMFLYRDDRGWDLDRSTLNYLGSSDGPFNKDMVKIGNKDVCVFSAGGGYYRHVEIQGGKNLRGPDFLEEFYAREDLILRARENKEIRGFGFGFEKNLTPPTSDDEEDIEEICKSKTVGKKAVAALDGPLIPPIKED